MDIQSLLDRAQKVQETAQILVTQAEELKTSAHHMAQLSGGDLPGPFLMGLTIFILSCLVGYFMVWKVIPPLHSPLMSITNAISSVLLVGALIGAGSELSGLTSLLGFFAVVFLSINIFGGFVITHRMLEMLSSSRQTPSKQ